VVAGFPSLSLFGMIMFQGRLFTHLCGLNPDSPGASTAFVANFALFQLAFLLATKNNVSLARRSTNYKYRSFSYNWVDTSATKEQDITRKGVGFIHVNRDPPVNW